MADFTAEEIVKALRCCGLHDDNECYRCPLVGKYTFNDGGFELHLDCGFDLYLKAADLIDSLLHKLCSLCAVCPADKRNPYDCEIIGTCKEGGGKDDNPRRTV